MDTESTLLARIAQKDEQAFRSIYDNYHFKVFTYAVRYLKSPSDAEEVVHEVFLKLWLRDPQAPAINKADQYFRTLTRNRCLDILRRKALAGHSDLQKAVTWREDHNDTEEAIILNDTRKILEQGISLLPPQQRLVYQLCREQGLKYEQAAEQLSLSPATVHTHMKLALKFLRTYVQQHTDIAVLLILFKLL